MKILVVSNLYPPHAIGGYEERCRQVVEILRDRGHDVRILTSTHGVDEQKMEGHIHRRLQIHGFFGHPWLSIQKLYHLESHNHTILEQEIKDFTPDVVHVWNLGGVSKSFVPTLNSCGLPVVYDVSDHWIARSLKADVWNRWWNGNSGGVLAKVLRFFLWLTGLARALKGHAPFYEWKEFEFLRIYFCSDALKQITKNKGYDVDHAAVIHCGVETAKFSQREPSNRFEKLLYVGRLSEDKDPLTAIRAMGKVVSGGDQNLKLSLYGRGDHDYVEMLKKEVKSLGIEGRVEFTSAPADEMKQLYSKFDALLFTSAWEEPFALTPLEGMASNIPVISTLSGGSKELVRDGDNALEFHAGDADGLASAVERLKGDLELRRKMVEVGLKEVRAEYDLSCIVDQIERYLQETIQTFKC